MSKVKLEKYTYLSHRYIISISNIETGYIEFIHKNKIIIVLYLHIYTPYRNNHYGFQVIEYLLLHYNPKCIIGEALKSSRGFWNKCIHKYGGQRKNVSYSDDCTSSFVIPKYNITRSDVYDLLEYVYEK